MEAFDFWKLNEKNSKTEKRIVSPCLSVVMDCTQETNIVNRWDAFNPIMMQMISAYENCGEEERKKKTIVMN